MEECIPGDLFETVEIVFVGDVSGSVSSEHPAIRIVHLPTGDIHPNRKRNAGIRISTSDVIALVDDDVMLTGSWFKTIYEEYHNRGYRGILSGPSDLLYDSGFSQVMTAALTCNPLSCFRFTRCGFRKKAVSHLYVEFCNYVLTREVWDHLEGLDESIDFYLDDMFFTHLAILRGISVINHPGLRIAHKRRDFPLGFYRYEIVQKFHLGKNFVHYPFLFRGSLAVWLSLLAVPVLILFLSLSPRILLLLSMGLFSAGCVLITFLYTPSFLAALLSPPFLFLFYFLSLISFYLGLIYGLIVKDSYASTIAGVSRKVMAARGRTAGTGRCSSRIHD
ncbi:MAG: glycosyltransferase [Candidatus Erginobacter occultus]|nr:glycosyltransferase [Candidatus Erginobacter occultus]